MTSAIATFSPPLYAKVDGAVSRILAVRERVGGTEFLVVPGAGGQANWVHYAAVLFTAAWE